MPFSTDDDLRSARPRILDLAPDSGGWSGLRAEAETLMLRDLEIRWFRREAPRYGLDPEETRLASGLFTRPEQLVRLSLYKTLELIYLSLEKETREPDAQARERILFRDLYEAELSAACARGLDYNWPAAGGSVSPAPRARRLVRG